MAKYRIVKWSFSTRLFDVKRKLLGIWWNVYFGTEVECEQYIDNCRNPIVKEYS